MAGERPGHSLQATALVNEAFLRLVDAGVEWRDRAHFLALAARIMRHILVDHALLPGRPAEDRDVETYALPSARALSPRCSRRSLFYLSGQGAGDGLWQFHDGNASEVWKGANDSLSEPPAVARDGTRVHHHQRSRQATVVDDVGGWDQCTNPGSIRHRREVGRSRQHRLVARRTSIVTAGTDAQALASAVAVFWIMSRRDHRRAATNPEYRRWRHIGRLLLIGIFFAITSLHDYEHGFWPRSFSEVSVLLGDGRFYLLFGSGVAVGYFLLRKPNWIAELWHTFLTIFKLRPSEFALAIARHRRI